jgi:hypothetical protein
MTEEDQPVRTLRDWSHLCRMSMMAGDATRANALPLPGSRHRCSLPKNHEGAHVAYVAHRVTGRREDVIWFGPWMDGRDYTYGDLPDDYVNQTARWRATPVGRQRGRWLPRERGHRRRS